MLIILFLDNTFKLYYSFKSQLSDVITVDNNIFVKDSDSKENEGFIGFFDWLRKTESEIVGIRLCYFDHHIYNSLLKKLPYVHIKNKGKWIEILFKVESHSCELSGDQDFTNNYVYESESGQFLLTFGLDHLTEEELSCLLQYCETADLE